MKTDNTEKDRLKKEIADLLQKNGYKKNYWKTHQWRTVVLLEDKKEHEIPLSNTIPTDGGFKREMDDYRWRKGARETPETIEKIVEKSKRVAPLYSKGSTQYINDGDDLKTIGKKI